MPAIWHCCPIPTPTGKGFPPLWIVNGYQLMEVILLKRIRNLGNVGDRVAVRGGFGRNYLIPKGEAIPASPENVAAFEQQRAALEKVANEELTRAQTLAATLEGITISVTRNAGAEGKLFGSVAARDVAEALVDNGHDIDRRTVNLPEGPIREVGSYTAELHLHADVVATLSVEVVSE